MFCDALLYVLSSVATILMVEERAGCFTVFIFLLSCDFYCYVAITYGAVGWSAVCDCGIS